MYETTTGLRNTRQSRLKRIKDWEAQQARKRQAKAAARAMAQVHRASVPAKW